MQPKAEWRRTIDDPNIWEASVSLLFTLRASERHWTVCLNNTFGHQVSLHAGVNARGDIAETMLAAEKALAQRLSYCLGGLAKP